MWGLILELKFRGKYESQKLKENKNENAKVMVGTLAFLMKYDDLRLILSRIENRL